ncbi:unnamed protein product [Coffea canephora]|uniref:Uncharacterized protein n=1 Tax=Coffea canephora TaxID=49390 RepID=A0A068UZG6_COFCA|nr:unnamed protein product [Coffea canephora]
MCLGSRNHELGQPPFDIMRFLGGGVFLIAPKSLVGWDSLWAVRLDSTVAIFRGFIVEWGGFFERELFLFVISWPFVLILERNDFDILLKWLVY